MLVKGATGQYHDLWCLGSWGAAHNLITTLLRDSWACCEIASKPVHNLICRVTIHETHRNILIAFSLIFHLWNFGKSITWTHVEFSSVRNKLRIMCANYNYITLGDGMLNVVLNWHVTGLILGVHTANERWRYFVTTSLIGWVEA